MPKRYQIDADPDADFNGAVADPAVVEEASAAWREEIAFAEQFTGDHDLGFIGRDSDSDLISLRELLRHLIEEYARHRDTPTCCASALTGASASSTRG